MARTRSHSLLHIYTADAVATSITSPTVSSVGVSESGLCATLCSLSCQSSPLISRLGSPSVDTSSESSSQLMYPPNEKAMDLMCDPVRVATPLESFFAVWRLSMKREIRTVVILGEPKRSDRDAHQVNIEGAYGSMNSGTMLDPLIASSI